MKAVRKKRRVDRKKRFVLEVSTWEITKQGVKVRQRKKDADGN